MQLLGMKLVDIPARNMLEGSPKLAEAEEVGVKSAAPYLVSAWLCHYGTPETAEQRAYHKHRATQRRAFTDKLIALKEVKVQTVGLEGIARA